MNYLTKVAIVIYVVVAVMTFGQAYKTSTVDCASTFNPKECQAVNGFIKSTTWPLYWSTHLAAD